MSILRALKSAALAALTALALAACDSSSLEIGGSAPGVASINVSSIVDNQATIDWNLTDGTLAEHWRLHQNDLLVCSGEPTTATNSDDNSSYQTGSCSIALQVGSNNLQVQLCNLASSSSDLCSYSAPEFIDYEEQTELGAISWQNFPSSDLTSENQHYLSWSKGEGVNGDYWHIYQNDAIACSGILTYDATLGAQSAGCNVVLDLGANQFQAQLCQNQPVGIADKCVVSPSASLSFAADTDRILATPILAELDASLPADYDISISWSKNTSSGSAGEDWSLFNNGIVLCQGVLTSGATSASCLTQLAEGSNQLQVRLCTDADTYSGVSCEYSATVAVEGFDTAPLAPGTPAITNSLPEQITDDPGLTIDWQITSGNGVSSWSVVNNDQHYCSTSSSDQYHQSGSCPIALETGVNTISVIGCNYGYADSESCSASADVSVEYIVLPGTPELTSSFATTTDSSSHSLSWERTEGEAADYWLAVVNDTSRCSFDLTHRTPQSGSCAIELDSGANVITTRLCIANESGSAYCSDSEPAQVELLAPVPAQPAIETSEQIIADDTIQLEWSKDSGDNGSYWSIDNNMAAVDACAGRPILTSGSSQSGSCTLPLELGANQIRVHLCNNNAAGTASCSTSESIVIERESAAPEFTSATSISVAENTSAVFYTAAVSDNDSSAAQISFVLSGIDSAFFSIDSSGGLAFIAEPDYESPQDADRDNTYQLSITATDETSLQDQLELSVSVSNGNDIAPEFTSTSAVSIAENTIGITHTVQATDAEGDSLSYALAGVDASHFSLDTSSGELSVIAPLDYENPLDANADNSYELEINASDGSNSTSQILTVHLSDLNDETPQATSRQSLALDFSSISLGVTIYTVTASDADAGDSLSYSLAGADASHFNLHSSNGDLSFIVLPSRAGTDPIDANSDSVYELEISISDLALNSSSFALSIAIADDVGHSPQFDTAHASTSTPENSSAIFYTALATDPEGEGVSYSLSGIDSSHFSIDPSSGALSPLAAFDYERPLDSSSDNNYSFTILASDPLGNQSQQSLDVLVSNANDNSPSFSEQSSGVAVSENHTATIYTAAASDADGDSLSYSLTGLDASHFSINSASGDLTFAIVADYEIPQDSDQDNTYELEIIASDGVTSAEHNLSVTVEDSNDNSPSFGMAADSISVSENGDTFIYTAQATDLDASDQITYSLAGNDASHFSLDPSSGELRSTSTFDFENPFDANSDNLYELEILASDGVNNSALILSIVVNNLNDNSPSFALESDSISVPENSSGTIYTAQATDPDGAASLTYSLLGADASAFVIDATSGALSFLSAPDFESPVDSNRDNHYELEIRASDAINNASLRLAVAVSDINDLAPVFSHSAYSVEFSENSSGVVYTAAATDADDAILSYSTSGVDASQFSIDSTSGELAFRSPPDFEQPTDQDRDNHYQLDIAASDGVNSTSLALTVALQDVNDNSPSFAAASDSISVPEHSSGSIYTAAATDADATSSLSYSLSGTDAYQFSINASSGALAFLDSPDFEKPTDQGLDNHYQLSIEASDGSGSASLALTIAIEDSNDNSPVFSLASDSISVTENTSSSIYSAQATDLDASSTITYSLTGSDASQFSINASSGALAFLSAPDFEQPADQDADNYYQLDIVASDSTNSASLALTIAVSNLNDNSPSFATASASIQVAENSSGSIYTAQATDLDTGATLSYSLSGADAYQFSINASSGALAFLNSPDFEKPTDQGLDNHYQLSIEASDGSNIASLALTIAIEDSNDNSPQFATATDSLSLTENSSGTIYTAQATDADAIDADSITYSLAGSDASQFTLDSSSGALAFLNPPDFEQPTDQNGNNRYQFEIEASDGTNTASLQLAVDVSDLNDESPQVTSATSIVFDFSTINLNIIIYTVTASDADAGDQLSYALGGADAQHFSLDPISGALAFIQQPSLSAPQDADGDNRYDLQITVSDLGGHSTLFDLEVRVADDIGSPPAFASASARVEFAENGTGIVYTAQATDVDNEPLTYSINGTDAAFFTIGASSGELAFRSPPDYEQPTDTSGANSYSLSLLATDPVGNQGQQSLTVQVSNVNDNQPVFNQGSSTIAFTENYTSSIELSASDIDGDTLSYSLSGADAAAFNINASSGAIWFASAPDYDNPHDSNQNNVYELIFSASDGVHTSSQNIYISIENLNDEYPQVTSPATATVAFSAISLSAPVYTLTATDPDPGDQINYVLGGVDAGHFYLNAASGELSFAQQPSLSAPLDADGDNIYALQITALDALQHSTLFDLEIRVADDIGSPPAFASDSTSVEFAENSIGIVYTALATDVDGEALAYSIEGSDSALFTIDSASGALAFRNPPDYEQPQDSGSDNNYSLDLIAQDPVGNQAQQSLAVQVSNANDNAPLFGISASTLAFPENNTSALDLSASDADGDALSYYLAGADASAFSLDSGSGVIGFVRTPDYEQPHDANQDNAYELELSASDSSHTTSHSLSIIVSNANDNSPAFTLIASALSIAENNTSSIDASASDADGDSLSYSLSGADSATLSIDTSSGALAFRSPPDFETPQDSNQDNVYELALQVSDGANQVSHDLNITITNLNDNLPSFAQATDTLALAENASGIIYSAVAGDLDGDSLSYSLEGDDASQFSIDSTSGELSFISSPDFENPSDHNSDNTYELSITASDGAGSASLALAVAVADSNDNDPQFAKSSDSVFVFEDSVGSIYTAAATDPDSSDTLAYSIAGTDSSHFSIDAISGELAFLAPPDYENPIDADADNVYELSISASDGLNSAKLSLQVSVINLNDSAPRFATPAESLVVDENIVGSFYTAVATDPESAELSYGLTGGDASLFSIDSVSGALAFLTPPDFENPTGHSANNSYEFNITASDGTNTGSLVLTVNVADLNDNAPSFATATDSVSTPENSSGSIYTAAATDPDAIDTLTYSLAGSDASQFTIDPTGGALSFVSAPDFEQPTDDNADNSYELEITASDSVHSASLQLTIAVSNSNDTAPAFAATTDSVSTPENNNTVIYSAAATDPEGDTPSYSIVGLDAGNFSIDASSGALSFTTPPDFEDPTDQDRNNAYELNISASDGVNSSTLALLVSVEDINDNSPSFLASSDSVSTPENNASTIYLAQAIDPDASDTLSYSLSGSDSTLFTIDSASGTLAFLTAPDFEQPTDSGGDNTYELNISATDSVHSASLELAVTVLDSNDNSPSFALSFVALAVAENNSSTIYSAQATDLDAGTTLSYSLTGRDASQLEIDSASGALAFRNPPDFETPQDSDQDNLYQLIIEASDGANSASQELNISISASNDETPQITSASSIAVDFSSASVGTTIYTVTASDADAGDQISYALSGADANSFDFDSISGALAFNQLPTLEEFQSISGDGIAYALVITATDLADNSTDLDLTVNLVDDTGSAPVFDPATASVTVDENQADSFYQARATDVDENDTLTYSISGTDSALFTIDSATGDLSFNSPPDYENPSDADINNVYELAIAATDSIGKQASQSLTLTILNLNDNSPQLELSSSSFSTLENTISVTTVAASDTDGDALDFSLVTSADSSFFSLDPSSGVLAFAQAPDFESAQDSNTDNTYELELSVFDGAHSSTASITVTVTNVDEAPSFTTPSHSLSFHENNSSIVYTASAADPEQAPLTYSISGTDASHFTLDSASGALAFKSIPDFETPLDTDSDNAYQLDITVSDGAHQASQSLGIAVVNVNEAPTFASTSIRLSTAENNSSFTHIVAAADDEDHNEQLTYQLSGTDQSAFNFDPDTRELAFQQTPDFENSTDQNTDNAYQIDITASDADYSTTQAITITVADLNDEAPQFTSPNSQAIDYSSIVVGDVIYTVQATDADANDQIAYAFSGADANHFSFDSSSGGIAFAQLPSLDNPQDANGDSSYELVITATDSASNSSDLALSISVVDDTGSAPVFAEASVSLDVDENSAGSVYTAQATDVDPGDILTYSITGTDAALFTIDSASGDLSFNNAPDYENPSDAGANNVYNLAITATDSMAKQASQSLTLTVLNLNDNSPQLELTSSSFSTLENTISVTTVAASDTDGDALDFSLITSADSSFFTLDPSSGVLAFAQAPDYESPLDSGANNTYELELSVFDGAHTSTQAIIVTVTDVDEAPSFATTSQSLSFHENNSSIVYTAAAADPEQAPLTYSASGTDASLFTLDSTSGELAFKATPDFETPLDTDSDNSYQLDIKVFDGAHQASQSLSITVVNVNEAPTFASTSINLSTAENNSSFTHIVAAADDEDQNEQLTYQLSGTDQSAFNLDPDTRELAFQQTPDFESPTDQGADNAYQIDIVASDGDLEATQAITITVTNVEESPYFHSSADHVEITEDPATEGTASPVLALSIQAADAEDDSAGTSLSFTISGGADSDKFSLTAVNNNSANLSFKTSPDFDNPHDANLDSNYSLSIEVADSSGDQAQHELIVQVLGVNDESPQLSSGASADVNENSTGVFYIATATDADRSDWSDSDPSKHYQPNLDSITFSLDYNNYPDSSFFSINSSSGELQASSGLDYEKPLSSAQSNYYTVGIKLTDSAANSSVTIITITVIDDPDEPEPVASSGPQIPWFYSDVSFGESIDIPWVIYSGDGAISWSLLVNGNTVCSESASISAPMTSGVCSVSSSYLKSGTNLNTTEVSVTYSDSSSESSEAVSFAYAVSASTSRYPTPTASVSDGIAACQNVDIGDAVSATSNVDCWNFLLGNDDFGGPYDEVPSYLTPNYGRGFDVIAYYGDWSIYERGFQPTHMPVNLLSTALYSFIMLDGDIPATQAANADEKECENCSFSGAVDFADYYSAIHKAYSLPDDPLATDKWLGTEGEGGDYVAYGTGIGEHWTDDSAYKGNGIFKQFWLLKQKFPHFKTCISVGGWSFSRPFPLIASNSAKLATFVESITDMAVKYHFDCIDIDWEFPGKAGGDYVNNNSAIVYDYDGDGKTPFITPTAADAGYFVNLIAALRAELDSRSDASHIEINSAVYTSEDGMALMDYNAFAGNLDGIHMMTYDYYGAWDAHTGLQAALYANSDPVHSEVSLIHGDVYNDKHNIGSAMARAVNNAIDNGFGSNHDIRRKLVPGLAFYGRNYSGVSTTPAPGKYMVLANSAAEQLSWEQGNLNYIQIEGYYEDGDTLYGNSAYDAGGYSTAGRSWTYRWDSESMAPFLYDIGTGSFIGYTDPRAIFYQTCHAARENSKGVMFWEMTQESADFHLVQAIHTAIRGDTLSQYADQPHCDDIINREITINNDDDDGGDTGGGNDDDDDGGDTGGGDTGGDTSSGTSGLQELEDLGYFTETIFNSLFYNTTLNQGSSTDGACTGYSFFNNWLDLKEAATYYPDFAAEGSMEDRLRELAAFLANTSHETTGAWQTYALDPALGARYHYGYCFKEEVGCENQTSCTQYCDSANTEYGYACSLGTTYHGRGPIQFTWNYNYGPMSEVLYGNNNYTLLENPSILVTDAVISYRSALWFWMTVQAPKPSAHDVMIGNYSAEASKNRYPGFGMTINIINGGLECGADDFAEAKNKNRLGFYLAYLKVLGDAYGSEISPWVTESSTSTTHGATPATYSAFDLNEQDLISRYTDVETYLSCKNMEHY